MSTTPIVSDELLSLNEAARGIGITYWLLRRLCLSGKVGYHRIGNLIFVPRSEAEKLVRESRVN